MKIQVSVEEVIRLQERLCEINRPNLRDIEWVDDQGNVIPCPDEVVDRFRFVGLSNGCFVEFCYVDKTTGFKMVDHDRTTIQAS